MSFLEIFFVRQCEVFVCFDFSHFFFFPWPQSSLVHWRGVNSLKNANFSDASPLNAVKLKNQSFNQ